ncbi:hypothetical protein [Diplocloster modestus]|uniref:Uncharacterized protein n=1 Tax=Diplocloster modestus TaxID=2850322 RepID=A0ABS6K784_9FIRM|nr:hypothetical protein [Diplocloster modestus]MBU9726377.1 hypothetical protein [Diplocloster modestus]
MNKSRTDRIKEAKHYEWLAMKALLPEEASLHLEAIGKELEALVSESLASCRAELMNTIISAAAHTCTDSKPFGPYAPWEHDKTRPAAPPSHMQKEPDGQGEAQESGSVRKIHIED